MQLLNQKAVWVGLVSLIAATSIGVSGQPVMSHQSVSVYTPGSSLTITNGFIYSGQLWSLLWRPQLPGGWTLSSVSGEGNPEMSCGEILWTGTLPPSPIRMVYTVLVAAGAAGAQQIRGEAEYQFAGMVNPATGFADPNPLTVDAQGGPPVGTVQVNHLSSTKYAAGATLSVTNTFTFTNALWSLLWRPQLPSGWTLGSVSGDGNPEMSGGEILWAGTLPPSPIRMVYAVQVPAGANGTQQIRGEVEYQLAGMVNPATRLADPNPLILVFRPEWEAPVITAQPQSRTVAAGTDVMFTVTASGTAPLNYQRRKNGTNLVNGGQISGVTTNRLAISNVQATDAGNYDVVVSNTAGSATSQVATLSLSGLAGAQRWEFYDLFLLDQSSPAIGADGTIYFGGNGMIYALDGATGTKRWRYDTGAGVRSSPAVGVDDTVYTGVGNDRVYALDTTTGAPQWISPLGGTFDSSPAIGCDGTIFIGSQGLGSQDPRRWKFYALDGVTGVTRWEFRAEGDIYSSPAIGGDGTVYVGSLDGKVYALDPDTGAKRWEFFTGGGYVISSPALGADGTVYVGSIDSKVYALNGATGAERWDFVTGDKVLSSPVLGTDGTVYVGSDDGKVYALNGATGVKRWDFTAGGKVRSAPAVGVDGVVYAGSFDKKL